MSVLLSIQFVESGHLRFETVLRTGKRFGLGQVELHQMYSTSFATAVFSNEAVLTYGHQSIVGLERNSSSNRQPRAVHLVTFEADSDHEVRTNFHDFYSHSVYLLCCMCVCFRLQEEVLPLLCTVCCLHPRRAPCHETEGEV